MRSCHTRSRSGWPSSHCARHEMEGVTLLLTSRAQCVLTSFHKTTMVLRETEKDGYRTCAAVRFAALPATRWAEVQQALLVACGFVLDLTTALSA